jgi:hypothetical protein
LIGVPNLNINDNKVKMKKMFYERSKTELIKYGKKFLLLDDNYYDWYNRQRDQAII